MRFDFASTRVPCIGALLVFLSAGAVAPAVAQQSGCAVSQNSSTPLVLNFSYDSAGELNGQTIFSNGMALQTVQYGYDQAGNITTLTSNASNTCPVAPSNDVPTFPEWSLILMVSALIGSSLYRMGRRIKA